jgi:hypothetical protein
VAEAIAELVEAPAGQRPLRTVVGLDFGAGGLNEAAEPYQRGALESWELGRLATITAAAATPAT